MLSLLWCLPGESMNHSPMNVRLALNGLEGPEVADRDMTYLIEEIRDLDVLSLEHPPAGQAPQGTRAGEPVLYTSLLLGLAGAPVLRALIALSQDWLARRNSGTIEIKHGEHVLRLTHTGRADQKAAIEAFISHAMRDSADG